MTITLYIFYMNNVKYTRQNMEKTHSPCTLQNVSNATTHRTYKKLNNPYTIMK